MNPTIFIDGDACPVKENIIEETQKTKNPVFIVTNIHHFSSKPFPSHVKVVYVDDGGDSADYRIIKLAKKGDILVTQDYGLASLGLGKQCIVLHHGGFEYTASNIDELLQKRFIGAQLRKAGKRTKGPKAFTDQDREKFKTFFKKIVERENAAKRESKLNND